MLSNYQFGFREGRSTYDALILVANIINNKTDSGSYAVVVDICKRSIPSHGYRFGKRYVDVNSQNTSGGS